MGSRCRAESCHGASTSNTVTTDGLSVSVAGGAEQLRQFTYAGRGFTVSRRLGHEGNKRVTLHLWCGVKRAQSQEKSNVERETGLEPATPCLEGSTPSQCPETTLPFWRKVASGARSRAPIHKAEGRVTVNEPNEEQYTRSPAKAQRSYLRVPGQSRRVSPSLAESRRVSARFRRASL
jgi:hypothetical protein